MRVCLSLCAAVAPVIAASTAELVVQTGHQYVNSAHYSPDGRLIVTAGDNVARLWDATTATEIRVFAGHAGTVESAVFSPSGKTILTASVDQTVRLWDAATGAEIKQIKVPTRMDNAVFSPDGSEVLTDGRDGTARQWSVQSGELIREYKTSNNGKFANQHISVAFSPDGREVLTSGYSGTVQLWSSTTGVELRRFEGYPYPSYSIAFSPDGRFILTGAAAANDVTRLWEIATGREI